MGGIWHEGQLAWRAIGMEGIWHGGYLAWRAFGIGGIWHKGQTAPGANGGGAFVSGANGRVQMEPSGKPDQLSVVEVSASRRRLG